MKTLLTILILIFAQTVIAQTKTFSNVINANGDTTLWYKYRKIVINTLSLTRLDTSSLPYYFRIWKSNQAIEIWQTNEYLFAGQLTSWVTEETPGKEKPTNRVLIYKTILRSDTIKQILNLIENSKIITLSTDDSIKGWKKEIELDGITYIIEFSSKTNYSFRTYFSPDTQDANLKEAKDVQSFVDKIFELSNSAITWKLFASSIPYECYNVGGTASCKIVTKTEKRKYAKERKNYRHSIK